jgi:hypothetical protein
LWLIPISAMTKAGCPSPMRRLPNFISRAIFSP